ncbi:MAG: ABC transporter substrate-binding protein [Spirochaetales bacterium]|nr:ABC transporter substrate-binding protein [Spirochaetales bacterium]
MATRTTQSRIPGVPLGALTVLAALILCLASGAPAAAQRAASRGFTILVPQSTSSLPLLLLGDEDPIPGVDFRVQIFINHAQALTALVRGDADALLTGTSQGWENHLGGGPLVLVNTGVWGVSYLIGSPKAPEIRGLRDLAGRRIALPFPGAPLDFQTRYLLADAGLDPDLDLEILYSPFGQTVPLLLNGRVDAAPLPEPLATSLVEGRGLKRLLSFQDAWAAVTGDPRSPQVSLFVTRDGAGVRRELLRQVVVAWRRTTRTVTERAPEVASRYAEALGMPADILARSVPYTLFEVPEAAENRRRVVGYYELLRGFLREDRPPLGDEFFLAP